MASKVNGLIQKVNPGDNIQYSIASSAYGYCETAAATAEKVVDMTGFTLLEGTTIHVKFANANSASTPTLNVNGTGAKNIKLYGTTNAGTTSETNGWYAGAVVSFTYDGTYWVRDQGFNTNSTYYYTSMYCNSASATAAKVGTISGAQELTAGHYFQVWMLYSNTTATKLTLNASGQGAKDIYINGAISSSTNYTLPRGCYIVYYDGTNYHFRTDNYLQGKFISKHKTGDSREIRIQSTTIVDSVATENIDYWWGVGTGDENHGLYDVKKSAWVLSAALDNNWTFNGSVAWSNITGKPSSYYTLPKATTSALGGVIVGTNISVDNTGKISVATGTTSTTGVVKLNSSTSSDSTTEAATPSAVKAAYALAASKTNNTGTVTSITAGAGLNTTSNDTATDGGSITSTGTLYLTKSGVAAATYGNTSQQTPSYGGTFNIPYFTVDKYGRITSANTATVKLPASDNSDTKNTAGSTNSTSKLYYVGTTSQTTSATTYSHSAVYATAGAFAATSYKVAELVTLQYNTTTNALDFVFT